MTEPWAPGWAAAWETWRFNQFHTAAGSAGGGQFASKQGGSGSSTKTAAKPAAKPPAKTAHAAAAAARARAARKAALHKQAGADRAQARKLGTELHTLQRQHAAVVKADAVAKTSAAKAKASAAKAHETPAQKAAALKKAAAAKKHATVHHASLKTQITALTGRISDLNAKARALDKQAAAL